MWEKIPKIFEAMVVAAVGNDEVGKVILSWAKLEFLICARVLNGCVPPVGHAGSQGRNDWMGIVATTSHITPLFSAQITESSLKTPLSPLQITTLFLSSTNLLDKISWPKFHIQPASATVITYPGT